MPDESIFPLVDRRAPILERVRGDKEGENTPEKLIGQRVGKFYKNDDEQVEAEELAKAAAEFRDGLAEELNAEPEDISGDVIDNFTALMKTDNVLDIMTTDEGDGEGEEDDDSAFSVEE